MLTFFFFSSRRRHTRCSRDWSSDVCSSDLDGESRAGEAHGTAQKKHNNVFAACAKGHSRSEEHTSELQSRLHLVCRLLLEKKKIIAVYASAVLSWICRRSSSSSPNFYV